MMKIIAEINILVSTKLTMDLIYQEMALKITIINCWTQLLHRKPSGDVSIVSRKSGT